MLRSITAEQLQGWRHFAELEPFGEMRQDYRIASIVQALYNINRDPKVHRKPFPIEDFLLRFGTQERETVKRQSWKEQKALLMALAAAHNRKA